ncbi:malonic semialdehyde reductase [Cellulomonas wangsupingiae]|uniref:Malonic semialdehyde reductase n=1 Tax=Cellulomonas wangsupingiae TaxID=2968085 RepID=A0ABY5K6T1_9CELL|nr:malonic semialdehyde reductase [Cellulomonas wangsupingiae]MCC2335923.1 malonic semialdehyde reductase [Cellulomonas wangsupingiae]MCM0639788.1 malonic semialdehyde reductase [Cellulomonas wangsupingiae]UUI64148.1 malonic semialdehyde reductase [Cellulomonas wangsupingiae]
MTTSELLHATPAPRADERTLDLLFRDARTTGRFLDTPVPDELLRDVHDTVRWGPTAMNTVPLRMLVVRSSDARERLAAHMSEFNRARVLAAPVTLVVAADTDFHLHLPTLTPHAPTSGDGLAGVPEVRARMARDNAWLQTGYLVVGLRAAGLGVGPMTGMDADGVDGEFFAGTSWRTLAVLNVGWPDGEGTDRPRAPRLAWDQVARVV